MTYNNSEVREAAKNKGVFLYEIADRLKMTDSYFSRKLRKELSPTEKTQILAIVDSIAASKAATVAVK